MFRGMMEFCQLFYIWYVEQVKVYIILFSRPDGLA